MRKTIGELLEINTMTLTEAKDQIAQQHDFDTWAEMDKAMDESRNMHHPLNDYERWQELHGEAATLYAIEKVKEALKLAAERAEVIFHDGTTKKETYHKQVNVGNNHVRPNRGGIIALAFELIENIKNEK